MVVVSVTVFKSVMTQLFMPVPDPIRLLCLPLVTVPLSRVCVCVSAPQVKSDGLSPPRCAPALPRQPRTNSKRLFLIPHRASLLLFSSPQTLQHLHSPSSLFQEDASLHPETSGEHPEHTPMIPLQPSTRIEVRDTIIDTPLEPANYGNKRRRNSSDLYF